MVDRTLVGGSGIAPGAQECAMKHTSRLFRQAARPMSNRSNP